MDFNIQIIKLQNVLLIYCIVFIIKYAINVNNFDGCWVLNCLRLFCTVLYTRLFVIYFTFFEININYVFIYLGDISTSLRWLCLNGCGRSYKYKHDLSRHMRKECGVAPQYWCKICSKMFKRNDHLLVHMARHIARQQQQW